MKYIDLNEESTKESFVTMFEKRNLVPVFGAGFTKGSPTRKASIPDGEAFRKLMLDSLKNFAGAEAETLSEKRFSEIAEHFLDPEFVPTSEAKKILAKYFIGTVLGKEKKEFLNCPWPYIYTLNIDDAIEHNSIFRTKILPNRNVAEKVNQILPCVYKVHGDVEEELVYDEPSKIIFSTGQYVRSLTTNQSMLNSIKTDLIEKNLIFVGCSLDNEIDLLYALAEYQGTFPEGRLGIYVTTSKPGKFAEAKLKKHGVNTILIIDDYDGFYKKLTTWASATSSTGRTTFIAHYSNQQVVKLDDNRKHNLSFLLRDTNSIKAASSIIVPNYYVPRDIEPHIIRSTESHPITLLRGRRFSGRTLLLRSIALTVKARNLYFIESQNQFSMEMVDEMMAVKNGLFIFDTNTLSADVAHAITKKVNVMHENGTTMLAATNRSESDVTGVLVREVSDDADFELSPKLSSGELPRLNDALNKLGIIVFQPKKSLLENTYGLLQKYPAERSNLLQPRELSNDEAELLLVVINADKAYSSLATALNIRLDALFKFADRVAPVLDIVETTPSELKDTNSRFKIISNSKLGAAFLLKHAIQREGYAWLAERIENIVKRLIKLPKFTSVAHGMYMFDTINYVLGMISPEAKGSGYRPVVRSLYSNLQPTLNDSADYWLQRAKAVLNLEDNAAALEEGIEFALKAHHDALRVRTADNAEFSIALLYGKLCAITKYKKFEHVSSAISWFMRAIQNFERNPNYVKMMLNGDRDRKNWYHQLCNHLRGEIKDPKLLTIRGDIDYLLHVQQSWRRTR